ncbi:MAG TPA: hypothetical protein VLF19_07465 [Methylomirabilota bacterium]|nr:hypothetical protein [Methylomirabilota bacterium]
MTLRRRLVITVCPTEPGSVRLPVRPGERARRLDARAIADLLERMAGERGLEHHVRVRRACAGGCAGQGPNVSVAIHPVPRPGEPEDHVAIGWRSYVASIARLDCLATIIDENLAPR